MKVIICFFFFLSYFIITIEGCDPGEISFELCKLDAVCTYQSYIDINGDTDLITFKYLYNRILYNMTFRLFIEDLLCTPNITLDNPDALTIWVHYMSQYSFCPHTNEYFDNFEKKCLCRPGKECHHEKPSHILFHFDANHYISWLVLFLNGIVFSLLYYHLKKKEIEQKYSNLAPSLSLSTSSSSSRNLPQTKIQQKILK